MDEKKKYELKKFTRVLKGYDTSQVDDYIYDLIYEKNQLSAKISELNTKIDKYKGEENLLKSVLISAEQLAKETRLCAERESAEIIEKAKSESQQAINKTSSELTQYKEGVYKIFYGYEHRLKVIIENFYSKARVHMEELEKEVSKEIEKIILMYDNDFNKHTLTNIQVRKDKVTELEKIDISWRNKEEFILIGKKINIDLKDSDGMIVLKKGTTITPRIINSIIEKGLYGELLVALNLIYRDMDSEIDIDLEEIKNVKSFNI